MIEARFHQFRVPVGLKWLLVAWLVAEMVAFAAVVHILGLGGAILLALGTSVLGMAMLRRVGLGATMGLRRAMAGGQPPDGALADGMLSALSAVLLILPGFVANLAGCALAAPSVRGWAARLVDGRGLAAPRSAAKASPTKVSPDVIDLAPEDWRVVERR